MQMIPAMPAIPTCNVPRLKSLALFSVFHPIRMGIADYTEDLARTLSAHFMVQGYGTGAENGRNASSVPVQHHSKYGGREDLTLFQVGNSSDLSFLLPYLSRWGGIVTLHDATQFDLTYPYFADRPWRFVMEAARSLDAPARRALIDGSLWNPRSALRESRRIHAEHADKRTLFRFTRLILRHAKAVIVHSQHLARYVQDLRPDLRVFIIPHGITSVKVPSKQECRRHLRDKMGVPVTDDTLLLVCFGGIQRHKRISGVLRALREFSGEDARVLLLIIGPRDSEYDLDTEISALGVGDKVKIFDSYLQIDEVNGCLGASDLCFNLRCPSLGSTSGTLQKAIAAGCPAVVTDIDAFAEYSEEMVFRVPSPGRGEWERCVDLLRLARRKPQLFAAMGSYGRRYADDNWAWPRVAVQYAQALASISPPQ
jgi:glycosyltransferase involved in cell wall biosynthesis